MTDRGDDVEDFADASAHLLTRLERALADAADQVAFDLKEPVVTRHDALRDVGGEHERRVGGRLPALCRCECTEIGGARYTRVILLPGVTTTMPE